MRIVCGRASFELNSNLLNSLSMRILIRIRVDRPLNQQNELQGMQYCMGFLL